MLKVHYYFPGFYTRWILDKTVLELEETSLVPTRAEEKASNFRGNKEGSDQIPYVQGLIIDAQRPTMPQWLLSHLC